MMKFILVITLFIFTSSALGQLDRMVDSRKKDYKKLRKLKYSLLPHRNTYLLPFVYNWMPNESIYQEAKNIEPANKNKRFYKDTEAEFQISFAIPLVKDINKRDWDIMLAYTHHSWWQVYNSAWSRPFRETNYMPELFTRYVYNEPKRILGLPLEAIDFGYIHQSNGQIQVLSRSWDRIFARTYFKIKDFTILLTGWFRLPEKRDQDDNPDIYNYMGVGDFEILKRVGLHHFHLKTPILSHHLSLDIKYSYPLQENLRWYLSYQSGYGHSLIEYDQYTQRAGVGFTLENIFY